MYDVIENITPTIRWAEQYIKEFKAKNFEKNEKNFGKSFDPFAVLTDTETSEQKMFRECVTYLAEIEKLTEDFRKSRKSIVNIMNV